MSKIEKTGKGAHRVEEDDDCEIVPHIIIPHIANDTIEMNNAENEHDAGVERGHAANDGHHPLGLHLL